MQTQNILKILMIKNYAKHYAILINEYVGVLLVQYFRLNNTGKILLNK